MNVTIIVETFANCAYKYTEGFQMIHLNKNNLAPEVM